MCDPTPLECHVLFEWPLKASLLKGEGRFWPLLIHSPLQFFFLADLEVFFLIQSQEFNLKKIFEVFSNVAAPKTFFHSHLSEWTNSFDKEVPQQKIQSYKTIFVFKCVLIFFKSFIVWLCFVCDIKQIFLSSVSKIKTNL
jgi:hypothetical protein